MPPGLKGCVLRPDQVERILAKYPNRDLNPVKKGADKRHKEYLALRRASKNPESVLHKMGRGVPDGGWFAWVLKDGETIRQNEWLRMAWLRKYKKLDIRVFTIVDGGHRTVEQYIRSRHYFSEKMIGCWFEILEKIPKGLVNE